MSSYLPIVVAGGDPSASSWAYRSLLYPSSGGSGGGTVKSVTAGTNIVVTGTATDPVVSASSSVLVNPLSSLLQGNNQTISTPLINENGGSVLVPSSSAINSAVWTGAYVYTGAATIPQYGFAVSNPGRLTRFTLGTNNAVYYGSSRAYIGLAQSTGSQTTFLMPVYGGQIYITTNAGVLIIPQSSSPTANWSCIRGDYISGTNFVAGVTGGLLYQTSDTGTTWTAMVSCPTANWMSIGLYNGTVVACTDSGVYYASTLTSAVTAVANTPTLPSGVSFNQLIFTSGTNAYVTTTAGSIYRILSLTGSAAWTLFTSVTGTLINSTDNGASCIVGTPGGNIYTLTSNGNGSGTTFSGIQATAAVTDSTKWALAPISGKNWSCLSCTYSYSGSAVGTSTAIMCGTSSSGAGDGIMYTGAGGNLSLVAERTLSLQGSQINFVAASSGTTGIKLTCYGTGSATAGVTLDARYVYMLAPTGSTIYGRQPFIQRGSTSNQSALSGYIAITLPIAYASATSYTLTVSAQKVTGYSTFVPDTGFSVIASPDTSTQFYLAWNGNTSSSIYTFNWVAYGN